MHVENIDFDVSNSRRLGAISLEVGSSSITGVNRQVKVLLRAAAVCTWLTGKG